MEYLINAHFELFRYLFAITNYSSELNVWIYIIAERLDWYVVIAGILFIILHTHGRKINRPILISQASIVEGVYISTGILIAWGISYLMKIGFAIARPFIQFPDVVPLFLYGGYNSFPSGHATLFSALAVAMYLYHKNVGSIFIFCAFIISLARVISGVHFPIDIIVGWILGGTVSYLTYRYLVRNRN